MKKVILSFDDGYHEDYTTVYPFLKSKNIKATSYLITSDVGREGHISWDEAREMLEYGWDFQCHTHNHEMLTKVDLTEIERDIRISKNEFFRNSFPIPEHFAYPYGVCDDEVKKLIKKHFFTARGGTLCDGGNLCLLSYGIHGKQDVEELIRTQDLLFLHTHDVSDNNRGYGVSPDKFKKTINLLLKEGFRFFTIKEYYDKWSKQ